MTLDREQTVVMGEADAPASPTHIEVGACRCPGSPHSVDWVDLKPDLDVPLAITANAAIRPILVMFSEGEITQTEANEDVEFALAGVYLRHSIERWSFLDERGFSVPIRPNNVKRLLPYENGGRQVQEAADSLYSERISAPFIQAGKAIETAMEEAEKLRMESLTRDQVERDAEVLAQWGEGAIDISRPELWLDAPGALSAVLAHELGGWEAVRGPGPMTYEEAQLSLLLLSEIGHGGPMRAAARAAKAREDAAAGGLAKAAEERTR